ncbi:MAG: 3-methyl-2-oxobutanoate hydroxymethyltransferase [Anaerolineae bacterium]|nr:3-methyl-2-oxobutanoate hydroxymethyltransferase [Anaerolineae bacterium]
MRVTIQQLADMKAKGERIAMLTAYDYSTAKQIEEAGVPLILVGDSLGMVILGYDSAIPVTLDDMIHHTKAVVRGTQKALVVGDLPFMTYHTSTADALRSAARMIQEGGAQAVKLEGGVSMAPTVKRVVECGIPVMGHIGLTPQSANQLGGFKVQGRSVEAAKRLLADAKALEEAGAFAIVLECIPAPLARLITERSAVPTIGIGAGVHCDGQVQVISDLLGMFTDFVPRHAKQYAKLGDETRRAVSEYIAEVTQGQFPTAKQSFSMDAALVEEIERSL